jgi:hypothetical protein
LQSNVKLVKQIYLHGYWPGIGWKYNPEYPTVIITFHTGTTDRHVIKRGVECGNALKTYISDFLSDPVASNLGIQAEIPSTVAINTATNQEMGRALLRILEIIQKLHIQSE